MSTFRRLIKESWRFYLSVLIIVLFLVICDSLYICRDADIKLTKKGVEQQLQTKIAEAKKTGTTSQVLSQGIDLSGSMRDKADNWSLMGFWITIAGIIFILIVRRFYFMDIRAEEFRRTLPVKERTTVMYDYFCMMGIILVGALVQGTILIVGQTCYNRNMMELSPKYSAGIVADSAVIQANQRLLIYMMCYLLFLLLYYTWIFLGMTIVKNPILGAGVSVVSWWTLYNMKYYLLFPLLVGDLEGDAYNAYAIHDSINEMVDFMDRLFLPSDFFVNLEYDVVSGGGLEWYNIWLNVGIMVIAIVIGILLIGFLGSRRELSKGKLFYFPILDYPFAFLCGIMVFIFLMDVVLWNMDGVVAMVIGFVAAVMVCLWIHPFSKHKSGRWEVK